MKILLVCTEKLPVPCIRGGAIQTYIEAILPHLSHHHDVTVFSVTDPELPDRHVLDGIRYERFPAGDRDAYFQASATFAAQEHFDLIIVYNRPRYLPLIAAAAPNSQFLLSMHNEMFHAEKVEPDVARSCLDRVKGVMTVSQFIADGIDTLFPGYRQKLHPVYAGVDINRFQSRWSPSGAAQRQTLLAVHGLENRKVIVCVGRLSKKKGPHILLEALPQILEQHPSAFLLLVGSKSYGHNQEDKYVRKLKKQASKFENSVGLTGFISPAQVHDYFLLGDIFICASQWQEPLARVHYEAMATGLCIATTMRGGNPEVIIPDKNGLLIKDYDDPAAFTDTINYLLSNLDLAEKMGRYGRFLSEQHYYWHRVASDILAIISEYCESPS